MDVYTKYVEFCARVGVAPASEETYEKVVDTVDCGSTNPKCVACHRARVASYGEACSWCIEHGWAPRPEVRRGQPASLRLSGRRLSTSSTGTQKNSTIKKRAV